MKACTLSQRSIHTHVPPKMLRDRYLQTRMDRLSTEYQELLIILKQRIRTRQIRAALAVNQELILLYWQIGREILLRQSQQG